MPTSAEENALGHRFQVVGLFGKALAKVTLGDQFAPMNDDDAVDTLEPACGLDRSRQASGVHRMLIRLPRHPLTPPTAGRNLGRQR